MTGHLYRSNGAGVTFAGYADGGSGQTTDPTLYPPGEGGGGADPLPTPADLICSDKSQMTPEQRLDYEISEEAAEIAREIMATGDKDGFEYASLIYRNTEGVITHTPIARGTPWDSVPSMAGITNWGQVLGVVHSHIADQWDPGMPKFKRFPTPVGAANGGDWTPFDTEMGYIYQSLISDYGLSYEGAGARSAVFRQYIFGPAGPSGSNNYELRGYDSSNRDTQTLGQKISLNLGLCS